MPAPPASIFSAGRRLSACLLLILALAACKEPGPDEAASTRTLQARTQAADDAVTAATEWRHYLGDAASSQYSPLADIHRGNVAKLREAWRYDPDDAGDYDTFIPTNPLVVKGVLYGLSARKNLFALNAASGEELWVYRFDRPHGGKGSGRGLVYWSGSLPGGESVEWLLVGLGHDLFAIDALSGRPATAFGNNGRIDLREGLDRPIDDLQVNVIAPGTLYDDLLIQGFGTSEFYGAAPGYIRAYHIPSGELRWTFRTIPAPGEAGADTWPKEHRTTFGGANSWAGITVDQARGLAFVPTGSAAFDYYGKNRRGDNLFANSLLALDAATGERLWHYQFVRHDLWDRDLPSPPNLITVRRNGESIPAVSQATKSGHLFVFHRETGEPLYPIEEVPVTGPGVPGEHLPASQPLPTQPPAFAKQHFSVSNISSDSSAYVRQQIQGKALNEPFRAPDEAGQVIYPGLDGGAQWGGQAFDAASGLLFVNTSEVPWHFSLVPTHGDGGSPLNLEFAYTHFCGGCHGTDRAGNGDIFPSLRDIGDKYWPWEVYDIVRNGRGRMPAFVHEPWYYLLGPIAYLYTAGDDVASAGTAPGEVTGYMIDGFSELLDEYGLPGSQPPWGSLVAIDTERGRIAWKVPLGDYPEALAMGLEGLGAANYGGPVVTGGDLVFIAATPDSHIRAFDKYSGKLLWQERLPAAGFATPAVYRAAGRQFVVVAAGGGRLRQASGAAYVAYALPDS